MFRGICLFRSAIRGGVQFNEPSTDRSRVVTITGGTYYRSFVVTLPSNCRAAVNRKNSDLSNKRGRQVSVTETVLGSTPVIVLSRTATDISPRGRRRLRGTVQRLAGNGAVLVVTRHLSAIHATSRVVILRGNEVIRHKGRRRLVHRSNLCEHFIKVHDQTVN